MRMGVSSGFDARSASLPFALRGESLFFACPKKRPPRHGACESTTVRDRGHGGVRRPLRLRWHARLIPHPRCAAPWSSRQKKGHPTSGAGCAGSRACRCARGRADATSCRTALSGPSTARLPLRAATGSAPSDGAQSQRRLQISSRTCFSGPLRDGAVGAARAMGQPDRDVRLSRSHDRMSCCGDPKHASTSACPRSGTVTRGVLSFAYFSLHEQRKVRRPTGRKGHPQNERPGSLKPPRGQRLENKTALAAKCPP